MKLPSIFKPCPTYVEQVMFIAIAAIAMTITLLSFPAAANADNAPTAENEVVLELDQAGILEHQVPDGESAEIPEVESFVKNDARNGILTDADSVEGAIIPDPFMDGETIDLVWHKGTVPDGLFMGRATESSDSLNGSTAVGISLSRTDEDSAMLLSAGGHGYGPGEDPTGGAYLFDGRCSGITFTPLHPAQDGDKFNMSTCWQKWAISGTPYWFYNRHTQLTTLDPNDNDRRVSIGVPRFVDFVIRSKPTAIGDSHIRQYLDWAPKNDEVNCQNGPSFEISFGGASISVPVSQCDGLHPTAFAVPQALGIDFDGNARQDSMRLDFGGVWEADDANVIPFWADYNWVELAECLPPTVCPTKKHFQWDEGWTEG